MRLIRVSWDRDLGTFMVETGKEIAQHDLSEEEKVELEDLKNQLEPYGEFLNVGDLEEEERGKVFSAKGRRAELEGKTSKEIVWIPKPENEVESVVLVLCPDSRPRYVENLPLEWIEKLFKSEVIIEKPQVFLGASTLTTSDEAEGFDTAPGSDKLNRVRKCLYKIKGDPVFRTAETYLDCVNVVDEGDFVKVTPKKYLEADWEPINEGLGIAFGKTAEWITEGKTSHWKI